MDDMIYRNNSIAEENIDPNGHPAKNGFEEWSEGVVERTDLGYKERKGETSGELVCDVCAFRKGHGSDQTTERKALDFQTD